MMRSTLSQSSKPRVQALRLPASDDRREGLITMASWPSYPTIYEINTWVWLAEIVRKTNRKTDLSSVPAAIWDALAAYGFDAVWLMGVWERSPAGIAIANRNPGLLEDFRRALP